MKIPLKLGQNGRQSTKAAQAKVLERDIMAAKRGDWEAKNHLVRTFTPLITSLAEKRSNDSPEANKYIEAGKDGLFTAVRKYKQNVAPDRFHIFALDFIEASMDRMDKGHGGFLSRLFGGK